jgi:hypothetical protein
LISRGVRLRVIAATVFLTMALVTLMAAANDAAEEAYVHWNDPLGLAMLAFAGANVIGAGLSLVRGGTALSHALAAVLLGAAIYLMIGLGSESVQTLWRVTGLAVVLVLIAALTGNGSLFRLLRSGRRGHTGRPSDPA